ncbi:MAG: hypothetical protein ACI9LY_001787 [Arenicella sp.]|jgi:hypothetical protein
MTTVRHSAPDLVVSDWLNVDSPITLAQHRGKVIVIEAFQMLCPGCVSHGLPQASRIAETFSTDDVVVFGLHSVFEHHEAQGTRIALQAFLHEYKIGFPVAIDAQLAGSQLPATMSAYGLRGTPSLLLIDRQGQLRYNHFGMIADLALGAQIMQLVSEDAETNGLGTSQATESSAGCSDDGCEIDQEKD